MVRSKEGGWFLDDGWGDGSWFHHLFFTLCLFVSIALITLNPTSAMIFTETFGALVRTDYPFPPGYHTFHYHMPPERLLLAELGNSNNMFGPLAEEGGCICVCVWPSDLFQPGSNRQQEEVNQAGHFFLSYLYLHCMQGVCLGYYSENNRERSTASSTIFFFQSIDFFFL